MSIQTEIDRINNSVASTYSTLEEMGATMPEAKNVSNLPKTAKTIPVFSGDYNDLINKPDIESVVNDALGEAKESGEFDGAKGDKGDDGTPATHSWNGTTLTITSASGTSSANLKGEKGDDGYTPQKGVDYFTNADKQELVTSVINALPTWTGGSY